MRHLIELQNLRAENLFVIIYPTSVLPSAIAINRSGGEKSHFLQVDIIKCSENLSEQTFIKMFTFLTCDLTA